MSRFREIKRKARRVLHSTLADQVLYVPKLKEPEPVLVTVRLHIQFDELGEVRRAGFAEYHDYTPRAVFMLSEVNPVREAGIVTRDMGVWLIDNTLPPDDITKTVEIAKLSEQQVRNYGLDPDQEWAGLAPP